jgi:hypothetical protein
MIEAFSVNLVKQVCGCRSLNMSKSVGCRAGCFSAPRSSSSSSAERRAARAEKAAYDVITNNELISLSSLRVVSDIYVCHYCPSTDLPQTDFSVNVLAQSFISFVLIFNLCLWAPPTQRSTTTHITLINPRSHFITIMATPQTRAQALSLYRKLLRGGQSMPTPNRQNFVFKKTRVEFKASVGITDPDAITHCIRLADTNLDTVLVQAEHLTKLMKDPNYKVDIF